MSGRAGVRIGWRYPSLLRGIGRPGVVLNGRQPAALERELRACDPPAGAAPWTFSEETLPEPSRAGTLLWVDWFAGKTAVVTGAAHGIGRGIAEQLASLGARVVAVDLDAAGLAAAFNDGPIVQCVGNVAASTTELVHSLRRLAPEVDILVNNVGMDTPDGFFELDEESFDHIFAVNLRGPWFLTRTVADGMVRRGEGGAILFISSLHDHVVRRRPHYSASKAAVAMLVRELAYELGPHGIRVNAISPGAIATASTGVTTTEESERLRSLIRLTGAQGKPEHVARMAAVLLCDHWSAYVTGANVPVDGGLGLVTWSQP